jgi:hypothetical protein
MRTARAAQEAAIEVCSAFILVVGSVTAVSPINARAQQSSMIEPTQAMRATLPHIQMVRVKRIDCSEPSFRRAANAAQTSKRLMFGSSLKNGLAIWPLLRLGPSQRSALPQFSHSRRAYRHIPSRRSAQCAVDLYPGRVARCLPCASIHFHKRSLEMHRSDRVAPLTLTTSAASPCP